MRVADTGRVSVLHALLPQGQQAIRTTLGDRLWMAIIPVPTLRLRLQHGLMKDFHPFVKSNLCQRTLGLRDETMTLSSCRACCVKPQAYGKLLAGPPNFGD